MAEARHYALYPIRIALAIVFFSYGLDKAFQYDANIQWFDGWGVPAARVAVPLVMVLEFTGAVALFLGVATRIFSGLLAIILLGAVFTAKQGLPVLGGIDLEIAMLGGLVALFLNGPGRPTVRTMWQEFQLRRAAKAPSSTAS